MVLVAKVSVSLSASAPVKVMLRGVSSLVEGAAAVFLSGAGGDHDDREVMKFVAVAEGGQCRIAIETGHLDIEEDEIG